MVMDMKNEDDVTLKEIFESVKRNRLDINVWLAAAAAAEILKKK